MRYRPQNRLHLRPEAELPSGSKSGRVLLVPADRPETTSTQKTITDVRRWEHEKRSPVTIENTEQQMKALENKYRRFCTSTNSGTGCPELAVDGSVFLLDNFAARPSARDLRRLVDKAIDPSTTVES